MADILKASALAKDYGGGVGLLGADISLPKGRIVGLLGSNGSGKTTFLKLVAGILTPTAGEVLVCGERVGLATKSMVSYLPERTYLNDWMRVSDIVEYFDDFYEDFDSAKAFEMLASLNVEPSRKLKTLSKGTKEKVQLVLVMARNAKLYLLDEPIAGVDPVAREYILDTIVSNYNKEATVIISTHLITDVEKVLDDFIFVRDGKVIMQDSVAKAREEYGKTLDEIFREVYKCSEKA
ncbi:MAG: ABC transporter ATP-binding protein [Ruminococcaceae bacterium]|nr:ABC transporter ATP-binding protein [Oscillospiraceae bacterium]